MLHYVALHYVALHYAALCCTALCCTMLHCTMLHYVALCCMCRARDPAPLPLPARWEAPPAAGAPPVPRGGRGHGLRDCRFWVSSSSSSSSSSSAAAPFSTPCRAAGAARGGGCRAGGPDPGRCQGRAGVADQRAREISSPGPQPAALPGSGASCRLHSGVEGLSAQTGHPGRRGPATVEVDNEYFSLCDLLHLSSAQRPLSARVCTTCIAPSVGCICCAVTLRSHAIRAVLSGPPVLRRFGQFRYPARDSGMVLIGFNTLCHYTPMQFLVAIVSSGTITGIF